MVREWLAEHWDPELPLLEWRDRLADSGTDSDTAWQGVQARRVLANTRRSEDRRLSLVSRLKRERNASYAARETQRSRVRYSLESSDRRSSSVPR